MKRQARDQLSDIGISKLSGSQLPLHRHRINFFSLIKNRESFLVPPIQRKKVKEMIIDEDNFDVSIPSDPERTSPIDFPNDEENQLIIVRENLINENSENRKSLRSQAFGNQSTPPGSDQKPNSNYPVFDYSGLIDSNFRLLGGKIEYFITLNLLVYLNARDLSHLSKTCKFFSLTTKSSFLWLHLYQYDFMSEGDPYVNMNKISSQNNNSTLSILMKNQYIQRYEDYKQRILRHQEDKKSLELDMIRLDRKRVIEFVIDFIYVRLFGPLLISCVILSIILYCQKVDGEIQIPIWGCLIPLGFAFFYLLFAVGLMKYIHSKQYSAKSLLTGLWTYTRGPLILLFQELLSESTKLLKFFVFLVCLLILQIGMVVVKLSWNVPYSFRHDFNWGIVFIPLWLLFVLYVISPLTKFRLDPGLYLLLFVLFWIPLAIFFIGLTVKLDQKPSLRIVYLLIPFYVLEGSALLSTAAVLITGIYRFVSFYFLC
jgi:hypothetical protein